MRRAASTGSLHRMQRFEESPASNGSTGTCAFYLFICAHRNLISSPVCRHHPCMISSFVRALVFAFKARRELALENVALRQQLAVVIRKKRRSRTAGSTFCGAHPVHQGTHPGS